MKKYIVVSMILMSFGVSARYLEFKAPGKTLQKTYGCLKKLIVKERYGQKGFKAAVDLFVRLSDDQAFLNEDEVLNVYGQCLALKKTLPKSKMSKAEKKDILSSLVTPYSVPFNAVSKLLFPTFTCRGGNVTFNASFMIGPAVSAGGALCYGNNGSVVAGPNLMATGAFGFGAFAVVSADKYWIYENQYMADDNSAENFGMIGAIRIGDDGRVNGFGAGIGRNAELEFRLLLPLFIPVPSKKKWNLFHKEVFYSRY